MAFYHQSWKQEPLTASFLCNGSPMSNRFRIQEDSLEGGKWSYCASSTLPKRVIHWATVSRPLISVGQLKTMLDLRMVWDDSSPSIHACSGGLRYILIEVSVYHNLPVAIYQDMHVLLQAIGDLHSTWHTFTMLLLEVHKKFFQSFCHSDTGQG